MAFKRTSDALAVVPEAKRSRNEIAAYTNRDKALMDIVSYIQMPHTTSFCMLYVTKFNINNL